MTDTPHPAAVRLAEVLCEKGRLFIPNTPTGKQAAINYTARLIEQELGLREIDAWLECGMVDPPVEDTPTIEHIANHAQRCCRLSLARLREGKGGKDGTV